MSTLHRNPVHMRLLAKSDDDYWRKYIISKKFNGNRVFYIVMKDGTFKQTDCCKKFVFQSSSDIGYIDGELFQLATGLNILVILDFLSASSKGDFQPSPSLIERTAAAAALLNTPFMKLPSNICYCISKRYMRLESITPSFSDDLHVDDLEDGLILEKTFEISMFDGLILESDTDESKCFKLKWGKFLTADVCIGKLITGEGNCDSKLFEALVMDDKSSNDTVKTTYPVLISEAMQAYLAHGPNKRGVFECFLDTNVKQWVAIKFRPDRTLPNRVVDVELIAGYSFNGDSLSQITEQLLCLKKKANEYFSIPRKMEGVIAENVIVTTEVQVKQHEQKPACKNFLKGKCKLGSLCRFGHNGVKPSMILEKREVGLATYFHPLQVLMFSNGMSSSIDFGKLHRLTIKDKFILTANKKNLLEYNDFHGLGILLGLFEDDIDAIFSYHRAVKRFLYLLFKGKCVIDVGSGSCPDAHVWLKYGFHVLAIDKDGQKVTQAQRNVAQARASLLRNSSSSNNNNNNNNNNIDIMHADAAQPGLRSEMTAKLSAYNNQVTGLKALNCRKLYGSSVCMLADCCCAFFSLQGVLGSIRSLDTFLDNILPNMKISSHIVSLVLDGDEFTALLKAEGKNEIVVLSDNDSRPLFRLSLVDNRTDSWLGGGYVSFQRNDGQPVVEILIHGLKDFSSPLHTAMKARGLRVERVCTLASFMSFLPADEQDLYLGACDRSRQISKLYKCVIWYREDDGSNCGLASIPSNVVKKAGDDSLLSLPSDVLRNILQYIEVPSLFTLASISASWLEFLTCDAVNISNVDYVNSKSYFRNISQLIPHFIYPTMDFDEDDILLTHEADLIAIEERISWERAQSENWTEDNTCLNCGILIGNRGLPGYCWYGCTDSIEMDTDSRPSLNTRASAFLIPFEVVITRFLVYMLYGAMLLSVRPNHDGAVSITPRDVNESPHLKFPRLYELASESKGSEFRALIKFVLDTRDALSRVFPYCLEPDHDYDSYSEHDYDENIRGHDYSLGYNSD